jgi:hypothetical protein
MRFAPLLLLGLAAAAPAAAHHGWGSYNSDKPMTIAGPIRDIALKNPHSEMTLTHEGRPWLITLAPLSRMNARGATADMLPVGANVTTYGYPKRDGTPEIRAEWIEAGGRRFQLR